MAFEQRYTQHEKATIIRLALDEDMTVPDAVIRAGINMPLSTAHNLVWRERKRRNTQALDAQVAADPWGAITRCRDMLLATVEQGTRETLAETDPDPQHVRDWAAAARAVASITKLDSPTGSPSPTQQTHLEKADELTQRLLGHLTTNTHTT